MGSYGLNASTIQKVITVNEAYKKLSLAVFNGSPMNPLHENYTNIPSRIYIAHLYARLRAAVRGLRDQNVIDTVAIGEFLAYDLPEEYYNNPNDASNAIVQVIQHILTNNLVPQYSALTTETYAALPIEDQDSWVTRFGLPPTYPYTQDEI